MLSKCYYQMRSADMVTNVFLVGDELECENAIAMIAADCLDDSAILKLTNDPYYLKDLDCKNRFVKRWEEFGVNDQKILHYATQGYKETEEFLMDYLFKFGGGKIELLQRKCFQLPLVMSLARDYFGAISILNQFILNADPNVVFMNERRGFATELIRSLTFAYGIPLESIEC